MPIIRKTYLVTIEIDTEKAKPFPEGFKDPSSNNGDDGMNWNTYPNWELNYQGCESDFIERVWSEFRSSFKYDGLSCQVVVLSPQDFWRN